MKLKRTFVATPTAAAPEAGFAFDQTVYAPVGGVASASIAAYTAGATPAGQGAILLVNMGGLVNVTWWSSSAGTPPRQPQVSFMLAAGQAKALALPYANGAATFDTLLFASGSGGMSSVGIAPGAIGLTFDLGDVEVTGLGVPAL